jgi:hypothetical protein
MLTGTTPFAGRAAGDIMVSKVIEKPKPPSKHNRLIPSGLERIIMRAVQPDRDNRFDSAMAMAEALEPYTRAEVAARAPLERSIPLRRLALGAALLGAIALAVFLLTRGGGDSEPGKATAPEASEQPALVSPATALPPDASAAPAPAAPAAAPAMADAQPPPAPQVDAAAPPPAVAKKKRKPKRKPKRKRKGDLPDSPIETLRPLR